MALFQYHLKKRIDPHDTDPPAQRPRSLYPRAPASPLAISPARYIPRSLYPPLALSPLALSPARSIPCSRKRWTRSLNRVAFTFRPPELPLKPILIAALATAAHASVGDAQKPAPMIDIESRAVATLSIPDYADFLAVDGRSVWVTNKGRVEKLSVDSPVPVASVPVPEPCGAMSVAFGSLWVANCSDSSLYRVDVATAKVVATIPTGLADPSGELSVATGAGSVWILSKASGTLSRIDPATNRVVAEIEVAPYSFAAVFGFDAVWITNTGARGAAGGGWVQRIDPRTNSVVARIPVGPVPRFLAAGEGAVWTLNQGDGTVSRIDPNTNGTVATIGLPTGMHGGGGDIAAGGGRVWVRTTRVLLASLDPATNGIVDVYGPASGSGAVRVAGDLVWVTAHDVSKVWVLQRTR